MAAGVQGKKGERQVSKLLTGYWPQHVGDEDLHQGLVEDVVTVPHPLKDGVTFTQRHQLVLRDDGGFRNLITVGEWRRRGKPRPGDDPTQVMLSSPRLWLR